MYFIQVFSRAKINTILGVSNTFFADYIRPICLPPLEYPPPAPGLSMETAGWKLTADGICYT